MLCSPHSLVLWNATQQMHAARFLSMYRSLVAMHRSGCGAAGVLPPPDLRLPVIHSRVDLLNNIEDILDNMRAAVLCSPHSRCASPMLAMHPWLTPSSSGCRAAGAGIYVL